MPDHDLDMTERLLEIAAAGAGRGGELLSKEDPYRVATVALGEVAFRLDLFDGPGYPVDVQIELLADGEAQYFVVTAGPKPAVRRGREDEPTVTVRQELIELVGALYGPPGPTYDGTRVVVVDGEPGPATDSPDDRWLLRWRAAKSAAAQVVGACSPYRFRVRDLATRVGSDKWGENWFAAHYEKHFEEYRDLRVRVLEIGVGGFENQMEGGESLRLWKSYFRRGMIYGVDIFDKSPLTRSRMLAIQGDQSDPASLGAIADQVGEIDVVIDDGSHISDQTIAAFQVLFPVLKPGGIYVVEDIQTSYWPGWNGNRSDFTDPGSWIGFVKRLIDDLHHQDRVDDDAREKLDVNQSVVGLHIYHNIVFIEKGINGEQTAPSWVHRHVNDMDITPKGSMAPVSENSNS